MNALYDLISVNKMQTQDAIVILTLVTYIYITYVRITQPSFRMPIGGMIWLPIFSKSKCKQYSVHVIIFLKLTNRIESHITMVVAARNLNTSTVCNLTSTVWGVQAFLPR